MELIGQRFGHIRVTEVVGQGGMGDVYGGYDEKLERKVALKVLNSDQRLDRDARERLLREARALSKIEHANICRIHDYIESGDVDLLVLEYIDGKTLTDVITERTSRSEKLRIASAVAGVLVAAHRAGIVHRDLKPDNVMITRDGEVKVLDFGLARWLNRARRSSDRNPAAGQVVPMIHTRAAGDTFPLSSTDFDSAAPLATAVGITLGTPLYMSPEQARGESLTPASDMFSFGLLLQALFTGEDPHPPGLTAREVILRVARGETNAVHDVPGDIAALIGQLKQFAPADRPTAADTLRRLRFLADKPQRIARRAIVAALVLIAAIGAWRYTVDLQRERAIAITARAEAERRRAQAEDLINFMVGDLRTKLEPVGRLDILDDVGKRAIAYVSSLDPNAMTADELARNGKALNQLGEVRLAQGNTPEALRMFRQAEKLTKEAVTREPKNGSALMIHGATEFWIGHALWKQGRNDEALPHMRNYMTVGETLAKLDPDNREYVLERAYGHSAVALILEPKGDVEGALRHYRASLEVKQDLAQREPDDANAQADLARAYNKVGVVVYRMGDLRGALDYSRKEVEIYRSLLRREPKQARWKQRLATSIAYLARCQLDMGDVESALALGQEELAIEQELAKLDPSNVESLRSVAMTTRWIGRAKARLGDDAAALALCRDAKAMMKEALLMAPTYASYVVDAAAVETDIGQILTRRGEHRRALEHLRESLRLLGTPNDHSARYGVARARFELGKALAASDPATARQEWDRAARELSPLMASSRDPQYLTLMARILIHLDRGIEARGTLAQLQKSGYDTSELVRLCAEKGC